MAFWSSETIKDKLGTLIEKADGAPPDPSNIDCCAYTLTVGPEVFITPSKPSSDQKGHRKFFLKENEHFQIPTGQFAFLLTEEFVKVPKNAIAFISIKAKKKFKGLINVSGFHVDPGWQGRLIFSVFNAGPNNITLARGEPLFLIWYSDLDRTTDDFKKNTKQDELPTKILDHINSEVYSPVVVKEKIAELEKQVLNVEHRVRLYVVGALIAILLIFTSKTWTAWISTPVEQEEQRQGEPQK